MSDYATAGSAQNADVNLTSLVAVYTTTTALDTTNTRPFAFTILLGDGTKNLNSAAATFTVWVEQEVSTGVWVPVNEAQVVAKPSSATRWRIDVGPMLLIANQDVRIRLVGTNSSDTDVDVTVQAYTPVHRANAVEIEGSDASDAINAEVDTAISDAGLITLVGKFTGITLLAQWLGAIAGKQTANATAQTEINATGAGSGTYDATTDSQEAIRDNGGGGLTQQQVADALKLAPAAGTPATGSVNADLDAIKAKTDLITAATEITVVGYVSETDELVLVAGDAYDADSGNALSIPIATGYTTPAIGSATVELCIVDAATYEASGTFEEDLSVTGSLDLTDGVLTATFELTAAETAALATEPPLERHGHVYQVRVTYPTTKPRTFKLGACSVKRAACT